MSTVLAIGNTKSGLKLAVLKLYYVQNEYFSIEPIRLRQFPNSDGS